MRKLLGPEFVTLEFKETTHTIADAAASGSNLVDGEKVGLLCEKVGRPVDMPPLLVKLVIALATFGGRGSQAARRWTGHLRRIARWKRELQDRVCLKLAEPSLRG